MDSASRNTGTLEAINGPTINARSDNKLCDEDRRACFERFLQKFPDLFRGCVVEVSEKIVNCAARWGQIFPFFFIKFAKGVTWSRRI